MYDANQAFGGTMHKIVATTLGATIAMGLAILGACGRQNNDHRGRPRDAAEPRSTNGTTDADGLDATRTQKPNPYACSRFAIPTSAVPSDDCTRFCLLRPVRNLDGSINPYWTYSGLGNDPVAVGGPDFGGPQIKNGIRLGGFGQTPACDLNGNNLPDVKAESQTQTSFIDASQFCSRIGRRLPTLADFQAAITLGILSTFNPSNDADAAFFQEGLATHQVIDLRTGRLTKAVFAVKAAPAFGSNPGKGGATQIGVRTLCLPR